MRNVLNQKAPKRHQNGARVCEMLCMRCMRFHRITVHFLEKCAVDISCRCAEPRIFGDGPLEDRNTSLIYLFLDWRETPWTAAQIYRNWMNLRKGQTTSDAHSASFHQLIFLTFLDPLESFPHHRCTTGLDGLQCQGRPHSQKWGRQPQRGWQVLIRMKISQGEASNIFWFIFAHSSPVEL